ncbi:MAG: BPL-N domain-containing protein [Thermoplasmata archaeon]
METRQILVYAGEGSSHSWTWLADLFESARITDVRFLSAQDFVEHSKDPTSIIVVSGGDGFQIAHALSGRGFTRLREFVNHGGQYVGVCAGAYLPLPSSLEPFNEFNVSTTRIENIAWKKTRGSQSPRLAVPYGDCSIVHPVRGEVRLSTSWGDIIAPIFGGPVFKEPQGDETLLRYSGFTGATEFQIAPEAAAAMVLGKPAAVRCRHGLGELVLLGPHLEHPSYPAANRLFLSLIGRPEGASISGASQLPTASNAELSHAVSDLKVAVLGLENRSFLVGNKLWDGSRFLELIKAIEKRCTSLDDGVSSRVAALLWHVRDEILQAKDEPLDYADDGPGLLVEAARLAVDGHFQALRQERMDL